MRKFKPVEHLKQLKFIIKIYVNKTCGKIIQHKKQVDIFRNNTALLKYQHTCIHTIRCNIYFLKLYIKYSKGNKYSA